MSTAAACERLFTLMDNQPGPAPRPTHEEVYQRMWEQTALMSNEQPLSARVLDAAPAPPPLHPQTTQTDSAAL